MFETIRCAVDTLSCQAAYGRRDQTDRQWFSRLSLRDLCGLCRLCVPGFNATVVRPGRVLVRGLDRRGQPHEREGTGLLARAFQHEFDHLDGTLFVDRLRGIKRDLIVRKIKKLTRAGKW